MTWQEESRALRATVPSPGGLMRLAAVLHEPVEIVGPLHGGVACSVHHLRTPTRDLVLKRFRPDDEPPPVYELEWERLRIVRDIPIPTPTPIACDFDGTWFGLPAIVLSYLPGGPTYPAAIEAIARTMAQLHATILPDPVPEVLHRSGVWTRWVQTEPCPPGMLEVLAALPTIAGREELVLAHCDLHPGNVLVVDGVVTGVVDWSGVRFAPRGFDVALTRCDLAIEPGGDAPAQFLAEYEEASGVGVSHLPAWDCFAAARAIEHGSGWVDAWTEVGVEMTAEKVLTRATAFARAALASLDQQPLS